MTIECLSTLACELCGQVRRGGICRRNTGNSARSTGDINDGAAREAGGHILAEIIDDPDMEWLMMDRSHGKAQSASDGNQNMEQTKGGSIFTLRGMRMVCKSDLLLQKVQRMIAKKRSN